MVVDWEALNADAQEENNPPYDYEAQAKARDALFARQGWTTEEVEMMMSMAKQSGLHWHALVADIADDEYREFRTNSKADYILPRQTEEEAKASHEAFMLRWRIRQEEEMNLINSKIDELQAEGRAVSAQKLTMDEVIQHCRTCFG